MYVTKRENILSELIQIKHLLHENLESINSILGNFILERKLLISSIPEICTAYLLFLVLPVTPAQPERTIFNF